MLFRYVLASIIRKGAMRLITAEGKCYEYGDGTPSVTVKLHRKSLEWSLGLNPELKIGEAYMNGTLTIEQGDLRDFLTLLLSNYQEKKNKPLLRWLGYMSGQLAWLKQFNPVSRARRNVAYHYDLPDELYDIFLDSDRQYSCGYFKNPGNSLEQAQLDKKQHIAAKLLLNRPGLKVLDIGSGWGGLALYLAQAAGCRVTGITLSTEQYKRSRERVLAAGLGKTCRFDMRDYRQETEQYDRIVSVGMFEHVGKKHYDEFFTQMRRLLTDEGVCLLHAVGRFCEPGPVNAFIRKYIFPGTDVPVLSEVLEPIERSGLYVTDIEILRLHYAETLKRWSDRFRAHHAEIAELYGEAFFRRWEFYLISCEIGFRYEYLMVFQIQLSKKLGTVPLTRDYMIEWERSHPADIRRAPMSA